MKIPRIFLALIIMLVHIKISFGCTIFTSSSNNVVLAANNEDMCTTNTLVHVIPPSEDRYGRILWGFKGDENYQGGMNEHGLFFDGAGTPPVEMSGWGLPDYKGYIFEEVLEKCKTVKESIEFVKEYSLPYLKFCHILVADASGDAVIFEWGNNQLNLLRKGDKDYLIATNFNITESINPLVKCNRYSTTREMLERNKPSLDLYEKILSLTHNEGTFPTVYSNICDLQNKKVYLYNFHNFSFRKEINLIEEFKNGESKYMIRSFFPVSNAETWFRLKNDCINDFDNLPIKQITFKVISNKLRVDTELFIKGSAEELGDWKDPGIKMIRINDKVFEKTVPFKEGVLFDYRISKEQNKYVPLDTNMLPIEVKAIEVLSDSTVIIDIYDWEIND